MSASFEPNPALYPFASHFLTLPGGRLHYLDEGSGEPIVMLHGNPTWSFFFRDVVRTLSGSARCIVPDHLGCGKSDTPTLAQYDHSLKSRIDNVEALLKALNITSKITLILHDWGGMIGMGYAARHPERIARIIALNTGCTRLPKSKPFPWSLWLGRNTWLGKWLILKRNAFCRIAAKWCVTRKPLAPEVRAMYLLPHDSPEHRISVLRFVQMIPLSERDAGFDIVSHVEASLVKFREVPTLLLWGLKDFVFDKHFLAEWQQNFPHAETRTWPDCGHYLLEDAGPEAITAMQQFITKHPISQE